MSDGQICTRECARQGPITVELFHLIYMSTIQQGVQAQEVEGILPVSRRRNAAANVTGMLLFSGKQFIQVLEGPRESVEVIYASIEVDPRHRDLHVLLRQPIPLRSFGAWSMGFAEVPPNEMPRLEDAFQITESAVELRLNERYSSIAKGLLSNFYSVTTSREL